MKPVFQVCEAVREIESKRRLNSALLCGMLCPQGLRPIVLFQCMYGLKPVPFREESPASAAETQIFVGSMLKLPGPARLYLKVGFGGEHTDSNQRLMYTCA